MSRIAIVTGASSGIGAAILKLLAVRGYTVIGLARRSHIIEEIAQSNKGRIFAKKCDVSVPEEIENVFDEIEKEFGQIDVLVNNAGIFRPTSIIDCPLSDLTSVLDVNVLGLIICTRKAVNCMERKGNPGHIINMNSISGHFVPKLPGIFLGIYSASKHTVTAITQSFRDEFDMKKLNIKITSISPGTVLTSLSTNFRSDLIGDANNLPKMPSLMPEDVADAVYFAITTSAINEINEIVLKPKGDIDC